MGRRADQHLKQETYYKHNQLASLDKDPSSTLFAKIILQKNQTSFISVTHITSNYVTTYLLPGNTNTMVGHPEDPENFFSSIHELRFS